MALFVIFVHIEGAFDNKWWPTVLTRVTDANCSAHMFSIIKRYFKHRKVTIKSKTKGHTRKLENGCPQGSVLGPAVWVWCIDAFLNELEYSGRVRHSIRRQSRVRDNTGTRITTYANKTINIMKKWCSLHRLKISLSKTVAMLVKGNLNEKHLPALKTEGKNVKYAESVKYLGIIIDKKLAFVAISQDKNSTIYVRY